MPTTAGVVDSATFATAVSQVAVAAGRDDPLPMRASVDADLANIIGMAAARSPLVAARIVEIVPIIIVTARGEEPERVLALPDLERNSFEKCEWDFIGPARDTLAFLQVLYHDHGGTDLVEKIFGLVRDRGSLARIGVM